MFLSFSIVLDVRVFGTSRLKCIHVNYVDSDKLADSLFSETFAMSGIVTKNNETCSLNSVLLINTFRTVQRASCDMDVTIRKKRMVGICANDQYSWYTIATSSLMRNLLTYVATIMLSKSKTWHYI